MAFFGSGERKKRPGVHIRIFNIGIAVNPYQPSTPPPEGGDAEEIVMLLVNEEGVLYPVGPALSLGDGGTTAIVADAVNATVYSETMVINNAR